ncbi:hypothetical protein [Rhodoblastus sp.]|uniref:hypothetical protein n=1 Tax=Rhodoblastus sp. TaxID=1962975 RepID=UPI0026368885|nr:hypothetical protein [Rhodoblastus sp.]
MIAEPAPEAFAAYGAAQGGDQVRAASEHDVDKGLAIAPDMIDHRVIWNRAGIDPAQAGILQKSVRHAQGQQHPGRKGRKFFVIGRFPEIGPIGVPQQYIAGDDAFAARHPIDLASSFLRHASQHRAREDRAFRSREQGASFPAFPPFDFEGEEGLYVLVQRLARFRDPKGDVALFIKAS